MNSQMRIIPKRKFQRQFFREFYVVEESVEICPKIQKPGPPRALFMTVYLCVNRYLNRK